MQIKIKSLELENYKKFDRASFEFFDRTMISGKNKEGKSTIMNAYMEILTGKEYEGKQPDGIRPFDEERNEKNLDDVIRSITLIVDGEEKTIRKITKRKMVKHHGTSEKSSGGNQTVYEDGDGYKMSKKEYDDFIRSISEPQKLLMCSNPHSFLNENDKSTTNGRKILEDMSGFDLQEFLKANPEYSEVGKILGNHGVEETWKKLSDDLKKGTATLTKKHTELNYESSRDSDGKIEISDLELAKGEWKEKLAEIDKQEQVLDESVKAYDSANANLFSMKAELNGIISKLSAALRNRRAEIDNKISELNVQNREYANSLKMLQMDLSHSEMAIDRYLKERDKARENWKRYSTRKFDETKLHEIEAEQFDEDSLVCPKCGQLRPESQQNNLREKFEQSKTRRIKVQENARESFNEELSRMLDSILEAGNKASEDLKSAEKAKKEAEQKIEEVKKQILIISGEIEKLCEELDDLPKEVDLLANDEYRILSQQIEEKELKLAMMNNGATQRAKLRQQRNQCMEELYKLESQIQKSIANEEQKERKLAELKSEFDCQKQAVADIERRMDILKHFSIAKNAEIEKMVNKFMDGFRFSFLEFTGDGDPKEVCDIIRKGVKYKDMNYSDRLLTEVSMIRGFQKMNNLDLPIWIDNSESINDDRLPELDTQMIVLKVTSDSLKVEPF